MDIVAAFHNAAATPPSVKPANHALQFTCRTPILQDAQIALRCGPHTLFAATGLVSTDVIAFADASTPARPAETRITLTPDLPLTAQFARQPAGATLWLTSTQSAFPLASVKIADFINPDLNAAYLDAIERRLERSQWGVNAVFLHNNALHMLGWSVPPAADPEGLPEIFVDGARATYVARADAMNARRMYWFLAGKAELGFYAIAPCTTMNAFARVDLAFPGEPQATADARFSVCNYIGDVKAFDLPPDENIHRVSGPTSTRTSYLNGGYTDYQRFRKLIDRHGPANDLSRLTIVDWGVGCARTARYFIEAQARVIGLDIDRLNIEWCKKNLPKAQFETVPLMPPSSLPAATADVIVSSSVLSHLTETAMDAWLKEMARILKPTGVAYLSYNGDGTSYVIGSIAPHAIRTLDTKGFFDEWKTADLDAVIKDKEYYRLTLMSDAFAQSTFAHHFRVEAIAPAVSSGHQNIAVLRRKDS